MFVFMGWLPRVDIILFIEAVSKVSFLCQIELVEIFHLLEIRHLDDARSDIIVIWFDF